MQIHRRNSRVQFLLTLGLITVFALSLFTNANAATVEVGPEPRDEAQIPVDAESVPSVTANVPSEVFLGQDVSFSVTFDNNDPADDEGYGPFADVVIDRTGIDGTGVAVDDGLGTILSSISASYMGAAIPPTDFFTVDFVAGLDPMNPTDIYARHPFLRDNTGTLILVAPPAGFGEGDLLLVARLPFGSFTVDQPPATLDFTVNMSDLADLNGTLNISARGGYEFGFTPLNDWCCGDAAYPDAVTGWDSGSVTPILMNLAKTYNWLEDETASGPNFDREFTITVDIADGQTLSSVTVTDLLPNNLEYLTLVGSTPAGAVLDASPVTPEAQNPPNNDLVVRWPFDITGGAGNDASVTFGFFVPRDDADGGRVIVAATGNDVFSCNNASVTGTWTPIDTRDLPATAQSVNPGGCEYTLTDKSIAIQKSVDVVPGTGGGLLGDQPAPNAVLEYTLNFQVSDFFAFDTLIIDDVISDGQHLDTSYTPQMTINGNGFGLTQAAIDAANIAIDCYYTGAVGSTAACDTANLPVVPPGLPPHTLAQLRYAGSTIMNFDVSSELIRRASEISAGLAHDHAALGRLLGGCVPLAGSANPTCPLDDGTTVTITFRTVILDEFVDYYPSGDKSVDQGDQLTNHVVVDGRNLATINFSPAGDVEDDDSAAMVVIGRETLSKTLYAVNDDTTPEIDLATGKVLIKPGDKVTYRLTYALPTSDVEELNFTDYLPLPIFNVGDYVWSFSAAGGIPAAGVVTLGPLDTFYAYVQDGITAPITGVLSPSYYNPTPLVQNPRVTPDLTNNMIRIAYGDYDDTRNATTVVDLLFSVDVTDEPFADRLYLTNEAHAFEGSTNAGTADANAIVQVILTEPILRNTKGIVWTDNANAVYNPTPASAVPFGIFTIPATPRWAGVIGSDDLSANPIDSNITGVDAGDIVTFAITIQNVGTSTNGAFDITILDTLPTGFEIPAGGLHLQIFRGSGTPVAYAGLGGGGGGSDDDLFYSGIELTDPGAGEGACQEHTLADGNDVVIITYDLQVANDAGPGIMVNTATLTKYAGTDGGPNHVPTPSPLHDDAEAEIVTAMVKDFVETEIDDANNDLTHAVIGEFVTYNLTITVPEGETAGATLVDSLPAGLAFVDLDPLPAHAPALSPGLSITGSTSPVVTNSGRTVTWNFGTITNLNRVNATAETITIYYRAVVLNVVGNQASTTLNNSATYTWTGAPAPITDAANAITVIEPVITTTKVASPDATDAGNDVLFTVTIRNTGSVDAYDLTWSDTVPAALTYDDSGPGSLAFTSCPAVTESVDDSGDPALTASISNLAPGDSCILTFNTTVEYSVSPGDIITNTATTRWTSLDDSVIAHTYPRSTENSDSTERTGSGAPAVNDYRSSGSDTVVIYDITPNKYLVTTSEAFTSGTGVAIGEIVRYRLVVAIPEGTSPNFQVVDRLPAGMTFLNDGTTKAIFVSDAGITSSDVGTLPVIGITDADCQIAGNFADGTTPAIPAACAALGDSNIGSTNSTSVNADIYASGFDVFFKIGTLLNSDSDPDAEYVVLVFNALVDNSSGGTSNDAGETLTNNFIVTIGLTPVQNGAASDNVILTVLEPFLVVTKSAAINASRDAGDTVTYTLTIDAASVGSRTTAFDLNVTDSLNVNLTPVSVVLTSTTQTSPCIGGAVLSINQSFSGQDMTATATCLDPGKQIVLTITATVKDTIVLPYTLPNTANLTYTSLAGTYGTTSNGTGSALNALPGYSTGSGQQEGERNGNGTSPNDYASASSAPLLLASPSVVKVDPSPTSYTIGQTVTYDIRVTLPEGVVQSLVVTDNIPSGTKTGGLVYGYKYVSSVVLASDPALTENYSGPTDVTLISGVCAGLCVTGDDVTYTFGNVTTDDDNNVNNNTFIVRVTLLVENVRGNQDRIPANAQYPTTLVNRATVSYTGGSTFDDAAAVTVIEPRITTTKLAAPSANVKTGDSVTYTVRFTNTGHSTAYEVTAEDDLSPIQGVTYNNDASCTLSAGATGTTSVSLVGSVLTFGTWDIPVSDYVECTFSVTAQTTFWLNGNHTNSIDADWTSLDGVNGNERSYNDGTTYNFDGTQDTVTRDIGSVGPTLNKSDGSFTDGTIGDTIHYTITVGGANAIGTIRQLVITDTLPAGVIYDGNVIITGLSYVPVAPLPAPAVSSPNDGSVPVTLTWTFGDIYKSVANATIEFDVHISNDTTNVQRTLAKTNSVSGTYRNVANNNVNLGPATDGFTIIEPVITTNKDVSPLAGVQAGDTVTYTVRFTNTGDSIAYDVTALDTLTQGVFFGSLTGCVNQASVPVPTTVTDLGATVTFDGNPAGSWDIAVGNWIQCTYTAIAQTSLYMSGNHVNTIDADWTSQNGTTPTYPERNYDDSVSRPGVDGAQDTDTATFTSDAPTFVKDDSAVTHVVIGDTITFHLTVGGEAGTYRSVVIADHLPAGLIYNNDASIVLNGAPFVLAPVVSGATDLTWTFGDLYKDATDMVITYSARVADVAGNNIGDVLINNATLNHLNATGTPATQLTDTEQSTITEPVIVTTKDITAPSPATGVDAGDTIAYQTRFTNIGTSTAYEVTAQDVLPANVDYNGDASCVLNGGATGSTTVSGTTTLNFGTWDIPVSGDVTCTYSITTQADIALGTSHTNEVNADWTSQNGTQPNERNYNDSESRPGVDETPGADDDDAVFTTDVPASLTKGINVSQTAIGDVFHITITINSPLGALTATSLDDVLPAGMVFVIGTDTVSANITNPGSALVIGPNDGTLPTTLRWNFGNPVVTGNPVVIEYDARAANVAGNVDGTNLTNNVSFYYTDGGGAHTFTDDATVTVIEPLLTVNKIHAVLAVAPDAGDTVHYIVDIFPDLTAPNVSTATAFDVVFTDLLPSTYVSLNVSSISVTATGWTPTSVNTSGSSATTVDVRVSDIPYTPGTNLRIEYDVTLKNTVTPSQLIANTGDITWTSTPGTNLNERTGSGTGANDYHTTEGDTFNIHDPVFSKSLVTTNLGGDANPSMVIGETATFGLHVTLPEGTTPSLHILDDLPPGLEYVVSSATVILPPGFIGTVPAPSVTPVTPPAGSGNDVTVDFGPITVLPDGSAANNTFTVRFQAVVMDENGNQQPNTLTNTATLTVPVAGFPDWTDSDSVNVNLIEPVLNITKSVSDLYPGVNQVLTFTLTVNHTGASTADAYDVVVYDDLPSTLVLDLALSSFQTTLSGGATGLSNTSSGNRVEFTVAEIPQGGSVQIQFEATVASTVVLSQTILNTAFTEWTSMPGDLTVNPQERTAPGAAWDDYRASSPITLSIQKSLSKTLTNHSLGATPLYDFAIGEIITYQVDFNVPVGSTTGVSVTDTLDLGLAFVDCVTISASAGITTTIAPAGFTTICDSPVVSIVGDPANPASDGRQVLFDFGNLNNTSGSVGLISIQYNVVNLDVIENQETTVGLNNSVELAWSTGPLHAVSPTPLDIVESDLLLTKTASDSVAIPGTIITFTLTVEHSGLTTADAYDVLLEDILPSGLEYVPGTLVNISGIAPTLLDDSLPTTLRVTWNDFPRSPGVSVIQFQAELQGIPPGSSVTNDARVEWTSLPGDVSVPQSSFNITSTERRYDPLSAVDIYGVTASFTVSAPALPNTGFAPGVLTDLPPQRLQSSYASLGDLWLEIPALGIRTAIVGVPMGTSGWDLTWLGDQAGYLEGTAYPSTVGNSGVTGHVYLANGEPGPFVKLHTLYWGQSILLHINGSRYIYKVQTVRQVWPNDLSALNHAEAPTLTLITCQGYNATEGNYRYRIAVQAVLVDIQPEYVVSEPDTSK